MIKSKNSFLKGYITGNKLWTPDRDNVSAINHGFRARAKSGGSIFNVGYAYLVQADEWKAKELLLSCGLEKKVLATVVQAKLGLCGGIYFSKTGVLTCCSFYGPYPWRDDRNYGIYDFDKISIVTTAIPRNTVHNAIFSHNYRWFYSKELAEQANWHAGSYNDSLVPAWDLTWITGKPTDFTSMTDDALYYHNSGGSWYVSDGWAHSTSDEPISNDSCGLSGSRVDPASVVFLT